MKYLYGSIIKDELINIEVPFKVKDEFLTEDLFQLAFKDFLLLDIGWYEKELGGYYTIYIIKNENWENPIFSRNVYNKNELCFNFYYALGRFDKIIEDFISNSKHN